MKDFGFYSEQDGGPQTVLSRELTYAERILMATVLRIDLGRTRPEAETQPKKQ